MRIYAIGDIHGQLGLLEEAHRRIEHDRFQIGDQTAKVVHLGDLVDRGPDSRGVIDFIIKGLADGKPWITIRGNHDAMFQAFLTPNMEEGLRSPGGLGWESSRMGGDATLRSYGIKYGTVKSQTQVRAEAIETVPSVHVRFLKSLPNLYATTELLFVHAGIRPGVPITRQSVEDLHWIRDEFLHDRRDHGPLIVHGHTPADEPQHLGNRVNLDTGAGWGQDLTAAVFEGRDCYILEEDGRRLLRPFY